jgi:hypothetical protein
MNQAEARGTSKTERFRQLSSLMAWGRYFGWTAAREDGAAEVRERWNLLRRAYRG